MRKQRCQERKEWRREERGERKEGRKGGKIERETYIHRHTDKTDDRWTR